MTRDKANKEITRIKELANQKSLTAYKIAFSIKVAPSTLYRIFNDTRFSTGRVKLQENDDEYYGYRGVITNYKTKNGLTVETQFNTSGMIYAKESKSKVLRILS